MILGRCLSIIYGNSGEILKSLYDLTIHAVEEGLLWQDLPKDKILFRREIAEVEKIICRQIEANRLYPKFDMTGDFHYIKTNLYWVTYDCLLAGDSHGFFEEDDLPPPELWVDYADDFIITVIPPAFLPMIESWVDCNFSFEWYEKNDN